MLAKVFFMFALFPFRKKPFSFESMPYLIVGLGNIGAEYDGTRHNVGFHIVDALAQSLDLSFSVARYGSVAQGRIKSAEILLLKPSTYMNLSGKAVRFYLREYKIPIEQLLVVVDDLALPFGTIRLKAAGSAAGHNGLKNINELLGTEKYSRLRVGIGNDFSKGAQIDYVLGKFPSEQSKYFPLIEKEAISAIKDFCLVGVERAMNWHNKKILLDE